MAAYKLIFLCVALPILTHYKSLFILTMLFYERLSKSSLVPAIVLGFATLLSTGLLPSTALAAPVIETSLASRSFGRLVERYSGKASGKIGDGGPSDTDYPSDDDINGAYIAPSGPFIFFSGIGDSQKPYEFSQTMPGSTILRGAFPKGYVTKGKPKRSGQWWVDFLDRISGAYTDKAVAAGQTVYFVGDFQATVSACSIWSRIELLTLKDAGIKIILVDYTDFQNKKDYPVDSSPHNTIGARNKDYCLDWEGSGEDPADPDSDDPHGPTYYPGSCGVHVRQVSSPRNTS